MVAKRHSIERRQYLALLGVSGSLGFAGCVGGDDGGEDPDSNSEGEPGSGDEDGEMGPTSVTETHIRAWYMGDVETVRELTHRDGPIGDLVAETDFDEASQTQLLEFEETRLENESDDRAEVHVKYTIESPAGGMNRLTEQVELRRENADWRVWGSEADVEMGPTSVTETHIRAWYRGDEETVRELTVPDGPMADLVVGADFDEVSQTQLVEFEEIRLEDKSDDRAAVRVEYTIQTPEGETKQLRSQVELRTEDGAWKVWNAEAV